MLNWWIKRRNWLADNVADIIMVVIEACMEEDEGQNFVDQNFVLADKY